MTPDVFAGQPPGDLRSAERASYFISEEKSNPAPYEPEISSPYETNFEPIEQEEYEPVLPKSFTKWSSPSLAPHALENIEARGPTLYYPAPIDTPVASPLTDYGAEEPPNFSPEASEWIGDSTPESHAVYTPTMNDQEIQIGAEDAQPRNEEWVKHEEVYALTKTEHGVPNDTLGSQTMPRFEISNEATNDRTKAQEELQVETVKDVQAQDQGGSEIVSTKPNDQAIPDEGMATLIVHEDQKCDLEQTQTSGDKELQDAAIENPRQEIQDKCTEGQQINGQNRLTETSQQSEQSIEDGLTENIREGTDTQVSLSEDAGLSNRNMQTRTEEKTQHNRAEMGEMTKDSKEIVDGGLAKSVQHDGGETHDRPLKETQVQDNQGTQEETVGDTPSNEGMHTSEPAHIPAEPKWFDDGSSDLSDAPSELQEDFTHGTIEYERDEGSSDVLRLKPTANQWEDFPRILAFARQKGADLDGCFKVALPDAALEDLPDKPAQRVQANAFKPQLLRPSRLWRVSVVQTEGDFPSSSDNTGSRFSGSAEEAVKRLSKLFSKSKNRQIRDVRYRVDVPAWTVEQRIEAGVPGSSPLFPLKGDKLDSTKAIIPGIHTPYVYESGPAFGATFQIHAEDFRLSSLNHLYKGRKIWIIVPSAAVNLAEEKLERNEKCSQFMRHRAEFVFPEKLKRLGIPFRLIDQRPGETIVILPDAYHEGFSTGYTLAEAKNYAEESWNTNKYQPCDPSCRLPTAIPGEFMEIIKEGESRLDLCATYDSESNKRTHDEMESDSEEDSDDSPMSKRTRHDIQDESPALTSVLA